jgi:SAM-dependent methyltransferase
LRYRDELLEPRRDLADLSNVQIRRARGLVPSATFIRADATTVDFPTASFDAVLCPYVLIHLLLDEQPALVARIATWLRSNGWFLATTGHRARTGTAGQLAQIRALISGIPVSLRGCQG